MPINKEHIQILFSQYHKSLLIAHRVFAPAPEIPLYEFTLASSAHDEEYLTVLSDTIHGHFHWRISGYSKVLNVVVNTTIRAGRAASSAAHRGAAIAKTAAHHGAILAERAAHDVARIATKAARRAAVVGLEIAQRRAIQAHAALHGYLPTMSFPMLLPSPATAPAPAPAAAAAAAASTRSITPPPTHFEDEDGFTHLPTPPGSPTSPRRPLHPVRDPKYDSPAVLLDYADIPADIDASGANIDVCELDRRIVLFNNIIEHVALNDPVFFQNRVMSPTFTQMIKTLIHMQGGKYRRYIVYNELFLPPAMRFWIDRSYDRIYAKAAEAPLYPPKTDDAAPQPPSPSSVRDAGTVAGYATKI